MILKLPRRTVDGSDSALRDSEPDDGGLFSLFHEGLNRELHLRSKG